MYETSSEKPVAEAFAARLNSTLDNRPWCPRVNAGRFTVLAKRLKDAGYNGNRETVRNWCLGNSLPRSPAMRALARVLDVPYAWLAHGHGNLPQDALAGIAERPVGGSEVGIGVDVGRHLTIGLVALGGAAVTEVPSGGAEHIRARIKGAEYAFHGAVGLQSKEGWQFVVPHSARSLFVVGIMAIGPARFRLIELDWDAIDTFGEARGAESHVLVPANLTSGDHVWREIQTFAQRP